MRIINVDLSDEDDRDLYNGVEKLLGFTLSFGEALMMLCTGQYGELSKLGIISAVLLLI